MGSNLVRKDLLQAGNFDAIRENTAAALATIRKLRGA